MIIRNRLGQFKKGSNFKHGMYGTKIYCCWIHMKQRCLNSNCKAYKNYGGRGIKMCKEWNIFENFYRDMGEMPKGKTLDRIKNNLGYHKENCQWSTRKEQQNNMRSNRLITSQGKTQTITQWSEELGINYNTIRGRLRYGWDIEKTLTLPVDKRRI